MSIEPLLRRLKDDLSPDEAAHTRMRVSLQARIGESALFEQAKAAVTPSEISRQAVWNRILQRIDSPAGSLLGRIGSWLQPDGMLPVLPRLQPVSVRSVSYTRTKWVAAFALIALAIRVSPVLFLAPRTVAESSVLLIPTAGSVDLSLNGLWQPVDDELTLSESVALRTQGGQATVLLHDDGTVRLDTTASVTLYDLSDRPEPALNGPTLALTDGRIWVQGLLPAYVRALTVTTPYGDVIVHDGSVSLAVEGGQLIVRVFDHSVSVRQGDRVTALVTGEQARFGANQGGGVVSPLPESAYDESWVIQNLERDAVHQREVAQMQRERSASKAGILPTSPLYSMKRVAEQVDVLLTLDPDIRLQKQIDLASTRLSEAVALVGEDSSADGTVQMEEYRQALQAIASGSGGNSAAQFLLRQEVAENAAGLSAAQPTDAIYSLKKAVLQASADLQIDVLDDAQVQGILLVDTLDALNRALALGDTDAARASYEAAAPYLPLLQSGTATTPELRKEALALLTQAAGQLQNTATGSGVRDLAENLEPFLPAPAAVSVFSAETLPDEMVIELAGRIMHRIDTFTHPRPRMNQLLVEVGQIGDDPDAGRILRQLYYLLPEQDAALKLAVRHAIQDLREE